MKIDYCPKCKKAGLKYERYPSSPYSNPPIIPTPEQQIENERWRHSGAKWCPRCEDWIKPESKEWSRK